MTVLAFVCKTKLTFNNISGESLSRDGIAQHLFQLSDVWGFKCFIQAAKRIEFHIWRTCRLLGLLVGRLLGLCRL